jgi:UDP-N-acetylglucosamine 1-carboxyvinyltransferase
VPQDGLAEEDVRARRPRPRRVWRRAMTTRASDEGRADPIGHRGQSSRRAPPDAGAAQAAGRPRRHRRRRSWRRRRIRRRIGGWRRGPRPAFTPARRRAGSSSSRGRRTLSGTIRPAGNKNAALPIIAPRCSCEQPVTLENVPRIRDVETLVELVATVGAEASCWTGNTSRSTPATVAPKRSSTRLCARIRASILLAGPAARALRRGHAAAAGRRRHRPSARSTRTSSPSSSSAPSVEVGDRYEFRAPRGSRRRRLPRRAQRHRHRERPDGRRRRRGHHHPAQRGQRAARAGPRALPRRARRPHRGHRHQQLTIHGGAPLGRRTTHRPGPHRGRVVHRARGRHPLRLCASRTPASSTCAHGADGLRAPRHRVPRRWRRPRHRRPGRSAHPSDLGGHVPKLEDQPWPAFPADLMSIAIVTATQCEGLILMHEKMFESRMFFVDKLSAWARASCSAIRIGRSSAARAPARRRRRVARHPRRHGDAARRAVRRGDEHDQQRRADRARLRAHRRAPQRARRVASSASTTADVRG